MELGAFTSHSLSPRRAGRPFLDTLGRGVQVDVWLEDERRWVLGHVASTATNRRGRVTSYSVETFGPDGRVVVVDVLDSASDLDVSASLCPPREWFACVPAVFLVAGVSDWLSRVPGTHTSSTSSRSQGFRRKYAVVSDKRPAVAS